MSRDTLVVVTATVDGYKGDGMIVNMHVCWISIRSHGIFTDYRY